MAEYYDELLDHEYDGIQELDNNLPRWWLGLFYICIIWAFAYMAYYHVFDIGYSQDEQYLSEVDPSFVRVKDANAKLLGLFPEYHAPVFAGGNDWTPWRRLMSSGGPETFELMTADSDTATYVMIDDPARLASGRDVFIKNCAQCHGALGEGGIGPNLTDDYWLHGAQMTDVTKSVKYGWPAKGMIPWRGVLKDEQILEVASFVMTLRGTNPPNAKVPQGDLVTE
jgi:cytochrome c oxidase cbb3-type subunit 3